MSDGSFTTAPGSGASNGPGFGGPGGRRGGDIDLARCMSEAWEGLLGNFPLWLGAGVVAIILIATATMTIIGFFLVVPVLLWGSVRLLLNMCDGTAEFSDLFAGFERYTNTLVPTLVLLLVLALISFLGQSVSAFGEALDSGLLQGIGSLVGVAWALLVTPRVNFAYFYLVDQDLSAVEAVQTAWDRTDTAKWKVAILMVLTSLICLGGVILFVVGVIPAIAFSYLMWASAYRQLEA